MNDIAKRSIQLREKILFHENILQTLKLELRELNRPAFVDAQAIIKELEEREAAKRKPRYTPKEKDYSMKTTGEFVGSFLLGLEDQQ